MKEMYIACEKSRDEMRLDLEGAPILITVEASHGDQASVFLENPDTVAELRDALDEWLERNA